VLAAVTDGETPQPAAQRPYAGVADRAAGSGTMAFP
jgi:hypothetical protein